MISSYPARFQIVWLVGMISPLVSTLGLTATLLLSVSKPGLTLPPPEDTPEEILRTEIITEARSPVDGQPLTAAEYAELQAQLEAGPDTPPPISPTVRQLVFLLRLRQFFRTILPL